MSSPQTGIQIDVLVEEVPPPSRTFAAVAEFGRVLRRVARARPVKRSGVGVLVAVDQRRRNLLAHAFEEGANLGQAEISGVAVEVRDILSITA